LLVHLRRSQGRKTRLLVGLLLLPALAFRVLIPPGFMPGTGSDDAPTMQMCHGAGPLPTVGESNRSSDGQAPNGHTQHEAPCVFAAVGSSAPPPPVALAICVLQVADAVSAAPAIVVVQKTLHRAQAARAPPAAIHFA
jgi:hypothetical protein